MKKTIKLVALCAVLLGSAHTASAQNWGFSLPFGIGGFAINKKNWTAGYAGATAGGGPNGWGFGLPNGAGFYNGPGGGGGCGVGGVGGATVLPGYAGAAGGCAVMPITGPIPPAVNGVFIPNQAPPGVYGGYGQVPNPGYVRRGPQTRFTSGWNVYPNSW